MSDFRLVDKKRDLKTIYGIPYCTQHIARLEKEGLFPKRVQLGPLSGCLDLAAEIEPGAPRGLADDDGATAPLRAAPG